MYVIRSMSTTDASFGRKPEPFHTYLRTEHLRSFAYWSTSKLEAATFETIDAALAHGETALGQDKKFDVVPVDDSQVATFWDARDPDYNLRVIGTEFLLHKDVISRKPVTVDEVAEFADWGPIRSRPQA